MFLIFRSEQLLAQTEVELPTAFFARHRVEPVSEVEAQHTEHRHEHPNTCTGRAVKFERIVRLEIGIRITPFRKKQHEDTGRLRQGMG